MERRWRPESGPLRAWWLTAAAAALVSLTAAPAPAPELRVVCDEQRTRCEWLAVATYGLRRPLDQWPQQSPFSAGWKKGRYGGGTGSTRNGRRATSAASGRTGSRRPFAGDEKRAGYAFSSWGGKRSPATQPRVDSSVAFDAKRPPAFSGWSGKRSQRFFNWGGKRSLADNELERMATAMAMVDLPTTLGHVDDDEINK